MQRIDHQALGHEADADAEAEAAVVALASSLFLQPRTVRALVEYWMRHYAPPVLVATADMAALVATETELSAGAWMARLVAALVRGPADLVLAGHSRFALTVDARDPRWLHWFSLFMESPSVPNRTLSVLVPFFAEAQLGEVCLALHRVYANCARVWATSSDQARMGTLAGEHLFADCRFVHVFQAFYPTSLVVVQAFIHFVTGLLDPAVLPVHLHVTVGVEAVMRAAQGLRDAGGGGGDPLVGKLEAIIAEYAKSDLSALLDVLLQLRGELVQVATALYSVVRDGLGYEYDRVLPEAYRQRSRHHDEAPHARPPPLGTYRCLSWNVALENYLTHADTV